MKSTTYPLSPLYRCKADQVQLLSGQNEEITGNDMKALKYCDVFDWWPSLLGNRGRNSPMDTLTTPVLLRYMATNSRRASVSIVAGSVKEGKTIHASQSTPVGLRS
jgi:hypothetical protein